MNVRKHPIHLLFFVTLACYAAYLCAGFVRMRQLIPPASRFADYFYTNFNSGDYAAMYDSSAFKSCNCSVRLENFRELMGIVMDKLGRAQRWERTGFGVSSRGKAEVVTIRFRVFREKGESSERLIMWKKQDNWELTNYRVDSRELMKK
jgi:hypothetical protein